MQCYRCDQDITDGQLYHPAAQRMGDPYETTDGYPITSAYAVHVDCPAPKEDAMALMNRAVRELAATISTPEAEALHRANCAAFGIPYS